MLIKIVDETSEKVTVALAETEVFIVKCVVLQA